MSNTIKKAIIPVAGKGTRFLPVTKSVYKTMFPIINKPTIQYLVEECIEARIEEIIIVISEYQKDIIDYFDMHSDYYKDLTKPQKELDELKKIIEQIKITFVTQPEPRGLGDAIMCCKEKIGGDDFAVLLGDDLVMEGKPCYGIGDLINQYQESPAYYVGVKEVKLEDCHKYGIVKVDETSKKMKVNGMVEKPLENPPSRYAGVGRYILRNNVFDYLKQIKDDHIHEIMLTDAFQMACMVEDVYAYKFNGTRFDIGDHAGYVKATIAYALKDENIKDEIYEYIKRKVENVNN